MFGSNVGSTFVIDPNDDQRAVLAVTADDVPSVNGRIGHPYLTVDPTGKYLYQAVTPKGVFGEGASAAVAKIDMETGDIVFIDGFGHNGNPIGMAHTADGRFTYVNEGHASETYKIDNETNEIVAVSSAGVAGPYGLALSLDESLLFTIGKGEGSHNLGSVVGIIDTKLFKQATNLVYSMPINLGGSARSIDHGIVHPDPAVHELWVSNMRGWETIVLDLDTFTPKAYIAQANGGNTHSGGFVKYAPDWTGELLVDMGGPQKALYALRLEAAAAKAAEAPKK